MEEILNEKKSPYALMFAGFGYMLPIVAWYIDEPWTMDLFTEKMIETNTWGMEYFPRYELHH